MPGGVQGAAPAWPHGTTEHLLVRTTQHEWHRFVRRILAVLLPTGDAEQLLQNRIEWQLEYYKSWNHLRRLEVQNVQNFIPRA